MWRNAVTLTAFPVVMVSLLANTLIPWAFLIGIAYMALASLLIMTAPLRHDEEKG